MTEEFERLIKQLADAVLLKVASELGTRTWVSAEFDARFDPRDNSWLGKIRVAETGSSISSIGLTADMSLALVHLEQHRQLGPDEWYGVRVIVSPDRRCEVNLNYDPECARDASFFGT